ncbi:hypothetical protein M621_02445 [Serratia plymuthica S13]|uniref:Uncharacterized protein n=1 Tax=Serratia plymuthica S13 TaxID=1348660 RepID=S4YV60_SERPL|nr:hypothetical protein M621_02445 [Serratia plymuthica S13]
MQFLIINNEVIPKNTAVLFGANINIATFATEHKAIFTAAIRI